MGLSSSCIFRIGSLTPWGLIFFTMLMEVTFCSIVKPFHDIILPAAIIFKNSSHGVMVHIFTLCLKLNKKPQKQNKQKNASKMGKEGVSRDSICFLTAEYKKSYIYIP